ncbi:putative phage tail component-like protein [Cytobacillus horneckiae]|uniref:distal tail protein Dit n=1 Tax=Cytobacillus horneckiae TaxID=549687 RepID=UPI0019D0C0D3|nr:phage tail family protein [Cytobacillus horneckiae]
MLFNNQRNNKIIVLEGRQKAPFAPLTREVVKKRNGHRLKRTQRELLEITQPIGFKALTPHEALQIKDEIASWLVTKEVVPLVFDNEPLRTYWVVVDGTLDDLSKMERSKLWQGTVRFLCFYTTGKQETLNLTTAFKDFLITGQTETPWVINVVFTERSSKFEVEANNVLFLQLNYEFVAGDRLSISYVGRKVTLNGQDLRRAVSMNSNFVEMQPGPLSIKASHGSTLKYDERFY